MAAGYFREAVAIKELQTQLDASGHAYFALGEAYRVSGQRHQALAAYRHAIVLDSNNANAKRMVEELGSK